MDFQERFEHLDYVHEAVFVLNSSREIVFGNTAAINHFGQCRLGQDVVQVIRNPDCLNLISVVLKGAPRAEKTIYFASPAKGLFDIRVARISDGTSKNNLMIISLRDASEKHQAEEMRSDFVANVSHELRSPLSTISGFIETLQSSAKDDPTARDRFLGLMSQEANRMVRLIADLLSLSKVEASQRNPPAGKVDVVAVVKSVHTSLAKQAKDEGKTVKLQLATGIKEIPGYEDELIQVVQNLLENALKYSASNTAVTIQVTEEAEVAGIAGPAIAVAVCDKGEGIARQHLSRLTERFYRVDSHRSRNDGGTGLGLAIVKHIVQRHRGRLKIESETGKGSTFTVYLPTDQAVSVNNPQAVTKL